MVITRLTLIPVDAAREGLSAMARVARPIRVRDRASVTDRSRTMATPRQNQVSYGVRHRAEGDARWRGVLAVVGSAPAGEELEDVAQEELQADRDDHHGDQSGAAVAQWSPEEQVLHQAERRRECDREQRRDPDRQAERRVERVGEDGPERDQLAVGEVGQAGRAEDHRQAKCTERQDDAEVQTVVEVLGNLVQR
ncbi:MAG: hypothetical protein WKF83_03920 [Nocardioidaceae bacterium]